MRRGLGVAIVLIAACGGGGGGGDDDTGGDGSDAGGSADAGGGVPLTFGTPSVTPATVEAGTVQSLIFSIPIGVPAGVTLQGVTIDVTAIGTLPDGLHEVYLTDSGEGADPVADDGVWTGHWETVVTAAPGTLSLPLQVRVFEHPSVTGPSFALAVVPLDVQVQFVGAKATPSYLVAGELSGLTLDVTTVATGGAVTSMQTDLTPLGGLTPIDLGEIATDTWRGGGGVMPSAPGTVAVTLRAFHLGVEVGSVPVTVEVLGEPTIFLSAPEATSRAIDQPPHVVSVQVTPGGASVSTLTVDASPVGGPAAASLFDDGVEPDLVAGDGRWTGAVLVPYGVPQPGSYPLTITATGAGLNSGAPVTATTSVALGLLDPVPSIAMEAAQATPARHFLGVASDVVLSVPASAQYGVVTSVVADLTQFGGAAAVSLHDDGLDGDAAAGDGVFSLRHTVPASATHGGHAVTLTGTTVGPGGTANTSVLAGLTVVRGHQITMQIGAMTSFEGGTILTPLTPGPPCTGCWFGYALPFDVRYFGFVHAAGQPFWVTERGLLSLDDNPNDRPAPGDVDLYLLMDSLPLLVPFHHLFAELSLPTVVLLGTAPDRELFVRWTGTYLGTGSIEFQVRFLESGAAEFVIDYGLMIGGDFEGWSQVAVRNAASFDQLFELGSSPDPETVALRRFVYTW